MRPSLPRLPPHHLCYAFLPLPQPQRARRPAQVVPTMILGTVLQGRRYTFGEYFAAALLILGISLFTLGALAAPPHLLRLPQLSCPARPPPLHSAASPLRRVFDVPAGDVEVNPKFHPAGVFLILVALFADAATSNFEEKRFFRCDVREVVRPDVLSRCLPPGDLMYDARSRVPCAGCPRRRPRLRLFSIRQRSRRPTAAQLFYSRGSCSRRSTTR